MSATLAWPELARTVRRQMTRLVGPGDEVDDLTQTALERVLRSIDGFEGRADIATYTIESASAWP